MRIPNPNQGASGFAGGINTAIFRYKGAPLSDPSTDPMTVSRSLSLEFACLGEPSCTRRTIRRRSRHLVHAFDFNTFQFKINGARWVPPTTPVLLHILSGAQTAKDPLPPGSVYSLSPNNAIEFSLPGSGLKHGGPVCNEERFPTGLLTPCFF